MNSRQKGSLLILRVLVDVLAVAMTWIAAFYLRFHTFWAAPKGVPEATLYLKLLPFICTIWVLVMGLTGFYRRTGNHRSPFVEALDIIQNSFVAAMAFIAFTYFYDEYRYSRAVLLAHIGVQPFALMAGRSLVRKALRRYRKAGSPRRLLYIGSGAALAQGSQLSFDNELQNTVVAGIVSVGADDVNEPVFERWRHAGIPVSQVPRDWPSFFSHCAVDCAVIALPYSEYEFLVRNLEAIADQVADVKVIPDLIKFARFSPGIQLVDGCPVISIHESPLVGWGTVAKRALDIVGAGIGLVVLSPILAAIAALVPLSSPGPVFYRQERMGLDGKVFRILKFRSMPVDAEKRTGAVWATADDSRPTRFGSLLRKFNLDELPQLINVLRGEMSLVGPRPERPVFVDKFRRDVPGYMVRHKVKAGMTGWAQVQGWRGNTSIERRIECDLYYIQNWSFWLDLKIIILTILRSFTDKNAY